MVEDEVLANVGRAQPNDFTDVDMPASCLERAPTVFPGHEKRPEDLLVDNLFNFLTREKRKILSVLLCLDFEYDE